MSLLPAVIAANTQQKYFVENIGGPGATAADAPCIKGTTLGAVRVGDPTVGLVLRGDSSGAGFIRGGGASSVAGSFLTLGASTAQSAQITMSDALITVAAPLSLSGAGNDLTVADDISLGGDLIFVNGGSAGASISGYWNAQVVVSAAGSQANPAGLTEGTYLVIYIPNTPIPGQQPSGVFYYNPVGGWAGNASGANFTTGPGPDCAILPAVGNATLVIGGSGPPNTPGVMYFRKLLN